MRVAHFSMGRVNPDSANGVDKTVYHLTKTQARAGLDVAVFSLSAKPPIPIPGVEVRTYSPMAIPVSLGTRLNDLLVDRSPINLPRVLVHELIDWRPDFLHLHFVHVPQNIVLAARARKAGIPYTVTINGGLSVVAQRRHAVAKKLFKLLAEGSYLERAAFLHVISEQDLAGVRSYGVSNETVRAPNGIDLDSLPTLHSEEAVASSYPALSGRRVFMFLGRLDAEQKGLDSMIRGFALAEEPDIGLLIAGPDWRALRVRLEDLCEDLGIADRVVFAGAVFGQEKFDLLAGSDVFIHPSRWEAGIPFSVLEAAAVAKPLLLSSGADPSRSFEANGAGLHAEVDPESLAAAIKQYAQMDAAALTAMGVEARRLVERDYAWRPIAQRVIDAYQNHV